MRCVQVKVRSYRGYSMWVDVNLGFLKIEKGHGLRHYERSVYDT